MPVKSVLLACEWTLTGCGRKINIFIKDVDNTDINIVIENMQAEKLRKIWLLAHAKGYFFLR